MTDDEINNNQKQLLFLPDEILEHILGFLDIKSKKNFSITCSKINVIFGMPQNMETIKLRPIETRKLSNDDFNITRRYRHVVENKGDLIPEKVWSKLDKITSYLKLARNQSQRKMLSNSLLSMLPSFRNLFSLEISWIYLAQVEVAKMSACKIDVIEMKHLRVLKIDLNMLNLLNERYLKFSTTQLKVLHLTEQKQESMGEKMDFDALKTLIASQPYLEDMNLQTNGFQMSKLFDTPIMVTGKLKSFGLSTNEITDELKLNSTQQDNFCDLLFAHKNSLEKLNIHYQIETVKTSKMQHLMKIRLDMPLIERYINIYNGDSTDGIIDISDRTFKVEELIQSNRPNLVTRYVNLHREQIGSQLIDFTTRSYPNLKSLIFTGNFKSTDPIEELNGLKHLESLTIQFKEFRNLPPVNISTLKELKFMMISYDSAISLSEYEIHASNLKTLLQRHKTLEKLELIFVTLSPPYEFEKMICKFHGIMEKALIELCTLRELTVSFDIYSIEQQRDDDEHRAKYILYDDWKNQSARIAEVIEKYAQNRFVFQCRQYCRKSLPKTLIKSFDGRVACEDHSRMLEE